MTKTPLLLESNVSPMTGHTYAETRPIPDYVEKSRFGVRVYQSIPNRLLIQVRTYGPTNERGTGNARRMMSNCNITREQATELRDYLTVWLNDEQTAANLRECKRLADAAFSA